MATGLPYETTFPSDRVRVDGALHLQENERGLRPRRLPAWTRARTPHPFVDVVVEATAGVRLVLRTEATTLELTLHTTRVVVPGGAPLAAAVDLVVDGSLVRRESLTGGDLLHIVSVRNDVDLVPGEADTVRFAGLAAGDKQVEIWLPQSVACDLVGWTGRGVRRRPPPATAVPTCEPWAAKPPSRPPHAQPGDRKAHARPATASRKQSAGHYGGTRRPPSGAVLDSSTTPEVFAMIKPVSVNNARDQYS